MVSFNKFIEERLSLLFEKYGVFFAFSSEQFSKNKKENTEYVSLGSGMIIPKDNVNVFQEEYQSLLKQSKKEYLNKYPKEEIVKYELINHECFYDGEYHRAHEELKDFGISLEEVERIYYEQSELMSCW